MPPKQKKRETVDDTNDREWKPIPPVTINLSDPFKTQYTSEETFKTYQLFSLMDVDNSGSVSLRELKRVLMGGMEDFRLTMVENFRNADTGMSYVLDEDNCVIIKSIEPHSPASKVFPLTQWQQHTSLSI